jgi:transcription antitermination factor NusG
MKWFAIKTKAKNEFKARDFFSSFEIESYVPFFKTKKVWSDRIKKIKVPAMPGYAFFKLNKLDYNLINLNPYTKNIVRDTSGLPAVISEDEICILKNYLNGTIDDDGFFNCKIGEKVKIICGPMIYKSGVVENVNNKTATITLESLNIKIVINKSSLIAA